MMKLFGKNNDLRTEEGKITKLGYELMLLSSVFGLCVFLTGRYLYGKSLREKQSDENHSLIALPLRSSGRLCSLCLLRRRI